MSYDLGRRTRMLRVLVAVIAAVVAPARAAAHFPADHELRALLQSRVDEGRAVGITLGLLEADGTTRVVFAGSAGEGARALGAQTVFEIGSITKVFTGTLLADMARRGEVSLSDPVARYLPDSVRVPSRAGADITLLDLATHRSGLPRMPTNFAPADRSNPFLDYSAQRLYAFLSDFELERDIGSQPVYSNLGVGLLGHALSRAAGVAFETLVQQRILEPLGMDQTAFRLGDAMVDWAAQGHDAQGSPVGMWDFDALAGAGALKSNVQDMLRFLDANIGEPASELEESMRLAHWPREGTLVDKGSRERSFGLNWLIFSFAGTTTVAHNGGTAGFKSFSGFDPLREIGVVVWSNSAHHVDDIGMHLLNPDFPLSPPGGQAGAWRTFVPPTAAAVAILLAALWRRSRHRRGFR